MWPFNKPKPKVSCFFCRIEVDKRDAFVIEYKSTDGTGKADVCPMCSGMLNDMINMKEAHND